MMMPYILCFGLPGSGKSTSAKILEDALPDFIRYNERDLRASLGMHPFDASADTQHQIALSDSFFNGILEQLRFGKSLLVDRAGVSERYRAWSYRLAGDFGADILAIWHDLPSEIAFERIKNRPDEHMDWERRIKHNDPELRMKLQERWTEPVSELDNSEYDRVSMIKYDTHLHTIQRIKVNPEISDFVVVVENILLQPYVRP